MNLKNNKVLIALLIIICGAVIYAPLPMFNIGSFIILFCGLALLFVYMTKQKTIPLILGGYMTYLGVMQVTRMFVRVSIIESLFSAMFFLVPGIIFLILFFEKGKRFLVYPAIFLIYIGIFVFLRDLPVIRLAGLAPMMLLAVSLSFFTVYAVNREHTGYYKDSGMWAMYLGGVFLAAAALFFVVALLWWLRWVLLAVMVILFIVFGWDRYFRGKGRF
jgi:hypothetical protein